MEKPLLDATKQTITAATYPGYPIHRLVMDTVDEWPITLPDGPWSTAVNIYPSIKQQAELTAAGYDIDAFGRPLHPWLTEMLQDPEVGVVTGMGEYWHWGPNRTADPIVLSNEKLPSILLIQRSDTGTWALPGGFVDGNEHPIVSAKRELHEEAGIIINELPQATIYEGVVADSRTTAHAWAETHAYLWRIDRDDTVTAGDDAVDARWFPITDMPRKLHGSHAVLIDKAIDSLGTLPIDIELKRSIDTSELQKVIGGHMDYDRHHIITKNGNKIFTKSYIPRQDHKADLVKSDHTRRYLVKEAAMYEYLRMQQFNHIPERSAFVDDQILTMDALLPEDGWYWRAPVEQSSHYIQEVLATLKTLNNIPLPDDFKDTLLPTYETLNHEGWDAIDDAKIEIILQLMTQTRPYLKDSFIDSSIHLAGSISSLRELSKAPARQTDLVFSHHDARQANIAWKPGETKIIDWSWAGAGVPKSDTTAFLVDLHKSGYDIQDYFDDYFSADHAITMIGFWLAHSTLPTRTSDATVRRQQIISAISAFDLLNRY